MVFQAGQRVRCNLAVMAAENVVAVLAGRRPPNLVNAEVWEKARVRVSGS